MNHETSSIPQVNLNDRGSRLDAGLLLTSLLGSSPYGVAFFDTGLHFLHINQKLADINGFPIEFHIGKPLSDILPQLAPKLVPVYQSVIATGNPVRDIEITGQVVSQPGVERTWQVSLHPIAEENGKIVGVVSIVVDITESKQTASDLQLSQSLLQMASRVSRVGAWTIDLPDMTATWSEEIHKVFELPSEFIPTIENSLAFFAPESRPIMTNAISSAISDGTAFDIESKLITASGRLAWVRTLGEAVRDEAGNIVRVQGTFQDITEQIAAEQNVRESNERFAAIINSAMDAIVSVDESQRIILFNPAAERIFGRSAEKTIGESLDILIPPQYRTDHKEHIRNYGETGSSKRSPGSLGIASGVRADGTVFPIEAAISRVSVVGGMVFTVVLRDITERISLEAQLVQSQKMEAVGQLAGGIAHDFNNLLTVINGYSELILRRTNGDDGNYKAVSGIHDAGKRAEALTSQLLAFSRQQVLEPKVLDLNRVISNMESMLGRLIGEDVVLSAQLNENLFPVKVDPGQFEQVLINLALNARDAMPRGGRLLIETKNVKLDAEYCILYPELIPGEYVMMAVSDTGTGIAEHLKRRIFEPFFTTKEVGKGTGLGLATVFGIVKQSDGHVAVYSEQGLGSTFKVYLPVVHDQVNFDRSEHLNPSEVPHGSESVLLVEDESAVRELAKQALEECGYIVTEAADGKEAVEIAERKIGRIDILVSDVVMPHLGGRELARKIVEMNPNCRVLFLSGYTEDAIIRHGIVESEFSFLQKPFTPSALARKVREVLDTT